jgi:hypothetical protein
MFVEKPIGEILDSRYAAIALLVDEQMVDGHRSLDMVDALVLQATADLLCHQDAVHQSEIAELTGLPLKAVQGATAMMVANPPLLQKCNGDSDHEGHGEFIPDERLVRKEDRKFAPTPLGVRVLELFEPILALKESTEPA